jgi:CII-binding regulator of phage lambda lysogenization HflD
MATEPLTKLVIDCQTGEAAEVPLTAEELAAQEAAALRNADQQATDTERTAAAGDFRAQAAAMTTALDAIIARNGTFTLAQTGQALDALAKGQKRLLRLLKAQLG